MLSIESKKLFNSIQTSAYNVIKYDKAFFYINTNHNQDMNLYYANIIDNIAKASTRIHHYTLYLDNKID